MKKDKAIFIGAREVTRGNAVGKPHNHNPVIFCIEAPILKSFIELHGSTPPTEIIDEYFSNGPILWDEGVHELTFSCWYWRCTTREWKFARFHAQQDAEPFFDGSDAYCLLGISDTDSDVLVLEGIPLSLGALSKLVKEVKTKKQFAMAAAKGVVMFSDFEAFEHQYLNALDDAHKVVPPSVELPSKRRPWH